MISDKPRPNDGPGSNGLRGGKKVYSSKTAVGHWMEEWGGPQGFKRGFHSPDFQTEAQHAQTGATLRSAPEYGAAISTLKEKPFTSKEVFQPQSSSKWESNYQIMTATGRVESQKLEPRQTISKEQLENYRQKWTSDTETSRNIRFETESRRSCGFLPDKFKVASVRMLPGTPRSLEKLRELIVEKYGILAISVVRQHLRDSVTITSARFREILTTIGVSISAAEFNQIVAYFTPKDDISTESLLRALIAKIENFDEQLVRGIFKRLVDKVGIASIPVERFSDLINGDMFPVVADFVVSHLDTYTRNGFISVDEFVQLNCDFFVSHSVYYSEVIHKLWL